MNKGRRHELKMLKFKQRLKTHRIGLDWNKKYLYRLRSMSTPCSCSVCAQYKKGNMTGLKKKEFKEIQFQLSA